MQIHISNVLTKKYINHIQDNQLKKFLPSISVAPGNNRVHFHGTGNRLQCRVQLQKLDKAPWKNAIFTRKDWVKLGCERLFFGDFWFRNLPSRKLTYLTWGKGIIIFKSAIGRG